nr:MAG TPA: hypothetical protein [Caudoviricetes sp.]
MEKYLRSTRDGTIFNWNPYLAARSDMEEVDEKQVGVKKAQKPKVRVPVASDENKDSE